MTALSFARRAVLWPIVTVVLAAPASAGQDAPAAAEAASASRVSVGASASVLTSYVWRGFVISDQVSVQPTVWIRTGDITISSFAHISHATAARHMFSEHDLTVEYSRTAGAVTMAAGWVNYVFADPSEGRYSNEVYVSATWERRLAPSLLLSHDFHAGSGTYISGGIAPSWPLGRTGASLETSAAIGYNHRQWTDGSGFSDALFGLTLSWQPAQWPVALEPFVRYSRSLDSRIGPSRLYAGIDLAAF
jgi:hypothetical protein